MDETASPTFTCSSCLSPFDWPPLLYRGLDFCCAGCAAGGPCCCSYDGHGMEPLSDGLELPMASGEWDRLRVEAERLERQLVVAIEQRHREFGAPADGDAPVRLGDIEPRQRRLAQLRAVLGRAHVTEPGTQPLIGARLVMKDAAGRTEDNWPVVPGDGAAYRTRVPADSPFGRLLLNARLGSEFALKVPGGARRMTLVVIDYRGSDHVSIAGSDTANSETAVAGRLRPHCGS